MEIERYNVKINIEDAITAYMAEIDENKGNGVYKVNIERGLFKAFNTDTRSIEPVFVQEGNYFDPKAKIDEFSITALFNEDYIYSQESDFGDYSWGSESEIEGWVEYDRKILSSEHARVKELIAEDINHVTDDVRKRVVYTIIWE